MTLVMILLQFQTISLPYKLCVTEKRTYANWNSIHFNSFCCQYLLINYLDSSAENLHSSAEIEPSQENSALLRNFFSVNLQKSQHPPPPPPPPTRYGNTGCRVFKQEIQNWKNFCTERKLLNFKNWINGGPQKFSKIKVLKVNYFHLLRKKNLRWKSWLNFNAILFFINNIKDLHQFSEKISINGL